MTVTCLFDTFDTGYKQKKSSELTKLHFMTTIAKKVTVIQIKPIGQESYVLFFVRSRQSILDLA
jgi:hypothetical protein